MSVLQDARRGGALGVELPQETLRALSALFWGWYHRHKGDRLFKKRLAIFVVTIKVGDLAPLFTSLFGPDPIPAPSPVRPSDPRGSGVMGGL